jgi:hypothetical protein
MKAPKVAFKFFRLHRFKRKKLKTVWRYKSIRKNDINIIEGIKRVVGVMCKHWVGLQSLG